jgi:NDP-sugar pyrophosphorylase family protein
MTQCVILAGGLASRLGERTGNLPKALIPVAGRPFTELQLEWLASQRVRDVVYCIGYRGDKIRAHVGDGSQWKLAVRYVDEGTDLRGTGGALRLALDEGVLAESFAVLYGDSYLSLDLDDVFAAFRNSGLPALMTVLRNNGRWDRSNADFDGARVTRYAKDEEGFEWIDYGVSVLARAVVQEIPPGETVDLADVLGMLAREGNLAGYAATERFYEIGSAEGLAELERFLAPGTIG